MRIIAGEFRGRRLLPPEGEQTRPVTDRVKQSLFDMLAPRVGDARVYDCFAGTGSFGLESLSRGAAHATFFEAHRPTLALLRRNIATLKVEGRATVISADCFAYLATARPAERAHLIFLDPPYRYLRERADELRAAAEAIAAHHLAADGLVLFRHDAADALRLPSLPPVEEPRSYGSMVVDMLGHQEVA